MSGTRTRSATSRRPAKAQDAEAAAVAVEQTAAAPAAARDDARPATSPEGGATARATPAQPMPLSPRPEAPAAAPDSAEASVRLMNQAADTMMRSQHEALLDMDTAGMTLASTLARMNRQTMLFLAERWREDLATQQELLRCRSLPDLHRVQERFCRTAMQHYADQTARMVSMGTAAMSRMLGHRA